MIKIHFLSNMLLLITVVLLSPTMNCGATNCTLYDDIVNKIRKMNNVNIISATNSMKGMLLLIGSSSQWQFCFPLLLDYVNELSNLSETAPYHSEVTSRKYITADEEEFSKTFLQLTSELLSEGIWEEENKLIRTPPTGLPVSPTFLLESVDRLIDTTVSQVINDKYPPSSGQTRGIFFESDQMIVEYEAGRSNYTDRADVTVISTKYKTISTLINQSANRSHYDDVTNHYDTPYCRKWQFSDKLCNETSQSGNSTPVTMFADDVLSISAFIDGRKRSLPVHIRFRHDAMTSVRPFCVFFDTHLAAWSDDGCHGGDVLDDVMVTCECNHTTTFALVLVVSTPNRFQLDELDHSCIKTFRIISFITGAASVLFLIPSLVIFLIIAMTTNEQIERITIHTHLAIALLLFNIVLISDHLQDKQVDGGSVPTGCYVIMLLLQFTLLSVFFWMLIEAYSIYRHVISTSASGMGKRKYLVGWGIPFCVTCTTLAVGIAHNHFTVEDNVSGDVISRTRNGMNCYLNDQLNWATFIPVLLVMMANLLALVRIFVLVVKLTNETRNMQPSSNRRSIHETRLHSVKKGMTSLMKLFPILGIPWIVALLSTFVSSPQLFCYLSIIHSLVNGSQGVVFFIVCVVRNEENRKIFQHNWKRMNANFTNLQNNHHDNAHQDEHQQTDGIKIQNQHNSTAS